MVEILPSTPRGGFCAFGRGDRQGRTRRSFHAACGRHGRPFRPQFAIGIPVIGVHPQDHPIDAGRSPDAQRSGPPCAEFIRAGLGPNPGPSGGLRPPGSHAAPDQKRGRDGGCGANPATPISTLSEVLSLVDHVLVMSVNPGFGGQHFIPNALKQDAGSGPETQGVRVEFRHRNRRGSDAGKHR